MHKEGTYIGTRQLIEIRRGERKGHILSPLLFTLYSEAKLEEQEMRVKMNQHPIADDAVLIANDAEELQKVSNRLRTSTFSSELLYSKDNFYGNRETRRFYCSLLFLQRMHTEREVFTTIKKIKSAFLDHAFNKGYNVLQLVLNWN